MKTSEGVIVTISNPERYARIYTITDPEYDPGSISHSGGELLAITHAEYIKEPGRHEWINGVNTRVPAEMTTRLVFVFGEPVDGHNARLTEEHAQMTHALMEARRETTAAQKEREAAVQQYTATEKARDAAYTWYASEQEVSEQLRQRLHRLERDLAKVKTQIGEKTFNDALKAE